jgi:type IV pilus assembly protein PilB
MISSMTETLENYSEVLLDLGFGDNFNLPQVIESASNNGIKPLRALLREGVPLDILEKAAWISQGYEVVDVSLQIVDKSAFNILPINVAKRLSVLPLKIGPDEEKMRIAVVDPNNMNLVDELHQLIKEKSFKLVVASPAAIRDVLTILEQRSKSEEIAVDLGTGGGKAKAFEVDEEGKIATLVKEIIEKAIDRGASDIHIEPDGTNLIIRFRVDGVLHEAGRYVQSSTQAIINRLKVMGGLDVGERRVPQDGRFDVNINGRELDMRLATIPTSWGYESAVMRILDRTTKVARLEDLGYSKHILDAYVPLMRNTQGTVLATGPTGSGKTTTLYATLARIATVDKKVLTVEDPVEYRFPGITQVQVNIKAGLTFPKALRSFLRADPDVILIGELRDAETASVGIQASLTGHLVLATVHANSSSSVPIRLIDMGIEPFLVASSLKGVISQRLTRKLCSSCKESMPIKKIHRNLPWPDGAPDYIYTKNPLGCKKCSNAGYRGRVALAEVLIINDSIANLIAQNSATQMVEEQAVKNGMITIQQDGLLHVANGDTSLEELLRVLG